MKLFVLIACLFGNLYSQSPATEWNLMSQAQQDSIEATHDWFEPYGFGFTAAANDWQESDGGLHLISIRVDIFKRVIEIAVGRHQIRIDFILTDSTGWEVSRLAEEHIFNLEFHRQEVLKRYQKLQAKYENNWMKIWSHWNAGNGPYGRDMRDKVRFLKTKFK